MQKALEKLQRALADEYRAHEELQRAREELYLEGSRGAAGVLEELPRAQEELYLGLYRSIKGSWRSLAVKGSRGTVDCRWLQTLEELQCCRSSTMLQIIYSVDERKKSCRRLQGSCRGIQEEQQRALIQQLQSQKALEEGEELQMAIEKLYRGI